MGRSVPDHLCSYALPHAGFAAQARPLDQNGYLGQSYARGQVQQPDKPTAVQMRVLQRLAMRRRIAPLMPSTRAEASAEIKRLRNTSLNKRRRKGTPGL